MGAAYKANDRELDRLVALKVIRPDLVGTDWALQRFKQELILARQITHKNVIRIYDLGEDSGMKFISMEYVEGENLATLLKRQSKLAPDEAVNIIEQVCRALCASHSEGIIHRDLKPANIMLDSHGKILVMDFGLARSLEASGLTQTGVMLGTMEYMSPEQAKAQQVDARSDVFTVGLIFYELLTGQMPYKTESVVASLLLRNQERATPVSDLDACIPRMLSSIVSKCLERDLKLRYQSAQEIIDDLERWRGTRPPDRWGSLRALRSTIADRRKSLAIAAGVLLLALTGFIFRDKFFLRLAAKPVNAGPQVSLAILPFRNASGDPNLGWLGVSLAEMLRTDIGQSSHLRTVSPDHLHQILRDLRLSPESDLDPNSIRRVAEFTDANTVISGQYVKIGDEIRIDLLLQNLKTERTTSLKGQAPSEKQLFAALDQLAQSVREKLALPAGIIKELQANSFKPSSKSFEALRYYNEGVELARQGNNLEALKRFQASTARDAEFALAFSRLAQTYAKLGYDTEAENFSRKAVELSSNLSPREQYVVAASHAGVTKDKQKAIEAYENLARVSPEDPEVQSTLAELYEASGSLDKARENYSKVLERDSKNVDALLATGRVNLKSGKYQDGLEYLNRALSLAIQLDNQEERATILHAIGNGYRFLNKPEEALGNYQQSLEIKRHIGDKRGIAASLNEIAQIQSRLGKVDAALASYREALQVRREIGDKEGIGVTLIGLGNFYKSRGEYNQALKNYKEALQVERDSGSEINQSMSLNNIGSIYFTKAEYEDALTYFQQALQLREKVKAPQETAVTLHNLGETAAAMGQYDQALAQYLRALEFRRKATDTRGAAIESYSMGTLFEHQGRYGAAIKSKQEALQVFRDLRDHSFWMGEILDGYGSILAQLGRLDEAQKTLDDAMSAARELKNQGLIAQTLNFQADNFFYRGEFNSARPLYQRALQAASQTADRDKVLVSKINLAKLDVKEGRSRSVIGTLSGLSQEVDRLGLKYLSGECSLYLAEALVNAKEYPRAQQELERVLAKTEKFGFRMLQAKGQFLTATALRLRHGGRQGAREYQQTIRILEELRKEAGSDLLQRPDLAAIYKESIRWSQNAKI